MKTVIDVVWAWAGFVAGLVWRGMRRVLASFASLVASPAVWLACTAVFVGGFCLGHWERGALIDRVRIKVAEAQDAEIEELRRALQEQSAQLKAAMEARDRAQSALRRQTATVPKQKEIAR